MYNRVFTSGQIVWLANHIADSKKHAGDTSKSVNRWRRLALYHKKCIDEGINMGTIMPELEREMFRVRIDYERA